MWLPTGAGAFFRELGILEKWAWSNNLLTMGTGSPFLSKDIKQLIDSIRRREVRTGVVKSMTCPVMSEDYVLFAEKAGTIVGKCFKNFVNECAAIDLSDESNEVDPLELLRSVLAACVLPITFELVPELSRASVHRGEAYAMMHNELYPMNVCFANTPNACTYCTLLTLRLMFALI